MAHHQIASQKKELEKLVRLAVNDAIRADRREIAKIIRKAAMTAMPRDNLLYVLLSDIAEALEK